MVLDDMERIRSVDKSDLLGRVVGLPRQIRDAIESMAGVPVPREYAGCPSITVLGMGGSGIPGDFLQAIYRAECPVPIRVHKDYGLPPMVGRDALVFAISYSGTTAETLDAFSEALDRGAKLFGISSGDRLLQLLREKGLPHYVPPAGRTSRESIGQLLFPMVVVLERLGYIPDQCAALAETLSLMDRLAFAYGSEVPTSGNPAKQIARQLYGKAPTIYASYEVTDVAGLRWKQQIDENGKMLAYLELFPELTHNHLAAVVNPAGGVKNLAPVFLRSRRERPELGLRIDATREVLARRGVDAVESWAEGTTPMAHLLSQSYLGDFVSVYLGVLNGLDPTPTQAMSELKSILGLADLTPH